MNKIYDVFVYFEGRRIDRFSVDAESESDAIINSKTKMIMCYGGLYPIDDLEFAVEGRSCID